MGKNFMAIDVPAAELLDEVLERVRQDRRIPTATYRLQLNRDFTFDDARKLVPYLKALGISHAYASPYFQARAESTHGYDITDHNALNPSIGTAEQYGRWIDELHAHGMGQILDTVPNHMGIGEEANTWWQDVLENGPSSPYARFFDIDWTPIKDELENKVLLPILGDQYGRVLENQELKLSYGDGAFSIHYYETCLPVAPRTAALVLGPLLERLQAALPADNDHLLELQSIITAVSHLPPRTETAPALIAERHREREIIKRRLASLCDQSVEVRDALDDEIRSFNGVLNDPRSFDHLDELIRAQAYRLAYWRVAAEEINYRRFFDINDLAAIRMERPEVFEATHRLILRLVGEGAVNGLRIDHPDGLWDPAGYFLRLQKAYLLDQCRRAFLQENPDAEEQWADLEVEVSAHFDDLASTDPGAVHLRPLLLYVEKILARGEALRADWPVTGTSGYDFLNAVNGLFVDGANEKAFTALYDAFIREKLNFSNLVYERKKQTMRLALASEVNVLAHLLDRISERTRHYRDFTLNSLTDAIREVIACFGVYRTYVTEQGVDKRDQAAIDSAVARAKKKNPAIDQSIFDFIRRILLLDSPAHFTEADRADQLEFVMKFQQCTGPVMAKGLEDTAFYIYNRLISLNEVGGEPEHFGMSVPAFHRQNIERWRRWPHALLASSTHDTKRSEDVRARINVLSELPRDWKSRLTRWSRLNRRKKSNVDGQPAPDRNEEYLLYQTLVGTWPLGPMDEATHAAYIDRIVQYMLKALREAKVNTSWLNPNVAYDQAVESFVRAILERSPQNEFLADFEAWVAPIADAGLLNALAQTLLKLTCPGVPDIYQGNELWDWSLVDPDNRRPVDYEARSALLHSLDQPSAPAHPDQRAHVRELIDTRRDGRIKLFLTQCVLHFRSAHAELFDTGDYTALESSGVRSEHVCAFARTTSDQVMLVVVPRLLHRLTAGTPWAADGSVWGETTLVLPETLGGSCYRNILTGEELASEGSAELPLHALFATLPFALLERVEEGL